MNQDIKNNYNKTKIIDGKQLASILLNQLKIKISKSSRKPKLAIIVVGQNHASLIYVRNKIKCAATIGMQTQLIEFSNQVDNSAIVEQINKLNQDSDIDGIIIQLPLPEHLNFNRIIEHIDPKKDVDGLHPINAGILATNSININKTEYGFIPCTALACLKAIESTNIDLAGKNVVIINRSNLIGKPLGNLLLLYNATVTICHSFSQNLKQITNNADIVIAAIGKANFFDKSYFKQNSVIIDVGISRQPANNQIYGDIDFHDLLGHASYITPVPGGIGPLTVAYLLSNTCSNISSIIA